MMSNETNTPLEQILRDVQNGLSKIKWRTVYHYTPDEQAAQRRWQYKMMAVEGTINAAFIVAVWWLFPKYWGEVEAWVKYFLTVVLVGEFGIRAWLRHREIRRQRTEYCWDVKRGTLYVRQGDVRVGRYHQVDANTDWQAYLPDGTSRQAKQDLIAAIAQRVQAA